MRQWFSTEDVFRRWSVQGGVSILMYASAFSSSIPMTDAQELDPAAGVPEIRKKTLYTLRGLASDCFQHTFLSHISVYL